MHRVAPKARRLIPGALLTTLAALPAQAAWQLNMTQGVTSTAQEAYDLHMLVLWICTIVGVAVFAVMIYAIVTFRKSKGAVPATFTHSTKAEMIWTVIPTLILVFLGYQTAPALVRIDDTRNSEMTIKITGYQWKWQYEYMGEDYSFFSTLADDQQRRPPAGFRRRTRGASTTTSSRWITRWSCRLGVKIRYLLTANDVLHAWWVPAFSVKRDAIPGFVNEGWFKVDKPGTYRGQCAELCGKDHGFMPIVVEALPKAEFEAWLAAKKAAPAAVAAN